jgi:methionyl-tRNA formyltransferase
LKSNEEEIKVKIYDVKKEKINHNLKPGAIVSSKNELKIAAKNGFILVESLQLAGKKKMDTKSLLNGFTFQENYIML